MSSLYVRDLIRMAQREYELNGCAYAKVFPFQVVDLLSFMGDLSATDLTFDVIEEYKLYRIGKGRARNTVNNELTGLRKGLKVAVDSKSIAQRDVPTIRLLRPGRPRSGFIYPKDFCLICVELRPDPRDVAEYAYWSGWRLTEVLELPWERTNEEWAWCYDKNGDIKLAPLEGHLRSVFERRRAKRNGDNVFHRKGKPIKSISGGWNAACRRAGFEGRVFHDMRRSFCRNGIRAGIDRDTVMKLSGHKTDSVFRRYNIQDEQDLIDAAKKLKALGA